MNYKTEQTVTGDLRLAARTTAMAGLNGWGNLFTEAADTIDNLRAQLAEAQRELVAKEAQLAEAQKDEQRLDWIIEHRAYARPDGTMWTQATEHETPRAAIDAARGGSNA